MPDRAQMRRAPSVRVECDLVLTDPGTGEPWLDRRGQWVCYRAGRKWGMLRQLAGFQDNPNLEAIEQTLCQLIVSWNWDDDYGDPLPSPPTPSSLAKLEEAEVIWLIEHVPGARGPK